MKTKLTSITTFFAVIMLMMGTFTPARAGSNLNPAASGKIVSVPGDYATIKEAAANAPSGSTIYIHSGEYYNGGVDFANNDVTVRNYPGEQVIIHLTDAHSNAFYCWTTAGYGAKTGIKIVGSDVKPRTLPNGVVSSKGIVVLGTIGSQKTGFLPEPKCDNWEIAGIDFVDVGHAIFTLKKTAGRTGDWSADGWHVHDNRVYGFYRETGMQFNGNENIIENNEIWKVTPRKDSPYGCYLLNLLGHGNTVRNNLLVGDGTGVCSGVLFEWSQSDANLLEYNTIRNVKNGFEFQGGDNNIVRYNTLEKVGGENYAIRNYSNTQTTWPCDDRPGGSGAVLVPPNDPTHPDSPYYYPYGECQSLKNLIIDGLPTQMATETPIVLPTPTATDTPYSKSTSLPTGPYAHTKLTSSSIEINGTSQVAVGLGNVPVDGYSGVEFTCTYNATLAEVSNITVTGLFGSDSVMALNGPQDGAFIVAIAGSQGSKATTSGIAVMFEIKGLQAGQMPVECQARISQDDDSLTSLPSVGALLTILGSAPTPTTLPTSEPTLTPEPSPTSEPLPTPTALPPTTGMLIGQVQASKTVTVDLYTVDNTLVMSQVVNTDEAFSLEAPAGTYTVIFSTDGYLKAQGVVTLTAGQNVDLPLISLLAGDIDGNNVIDQFDALTIGMSYNTALPAAADLNNDGIINLIDLKQLAQNFRKSGPLPWE